ncbi:MAG TPA: YgjP-like metallopeptidase domain-containing protein [Polyangiaceae bacterium]|nr:YgjP-like metallopeptidase domain-containing protein [Polyangiaceae bacterium]
MRSPSLEYLAGYPATLLEQVRQLLDEGKLRPLLEAKYPSAPEITNDRALYEYVQELKGRFLRRAPPISVVRFDDRIGPKGVLGLHTHISRVQGSRTKAKNEVRVSSLLKTTPPELLHMVVVHELAHLKEKDHDKAFYQLCVHIEPRYHELELDLRLWLTARAEAPVASTD